MRNRVRTWLTLLAAVTILVPSLWGFGTKFLELVALYRGDSQGAFAIAPIVNYLLASAGFLLLFGWAAANGMFHDIERPKRTMLENEERLDAADRRANSSAR
jgi:nitrogen fixation-related uncharacterized protein